MNNEIQPFKTPEMLTGLHIDPMSDIQGGRP